MSTSKHFTKVLVANRGEIAVRVMKTAAKLGYSTVAVYSDTDYQAPHVKHADAAYALGGTTALESYLDIDKVIEIAKQAGADAVHPGYGFLSENTEFAQRCEQANIAFVGPPSDAIKLMASKRLSKLAMLDAGVPCIPGYEGADQSLETLATEAQKIGYPLMIKASAGGGGRGMRLVENQSDLEMALKTAKTEAKNAFGNDEVILEKAILEPRHIEIQVFGDTHGNVVHLGERDCSIQRRHQKVVEEAPSPFVDDALRQNMGASAVAVAEACQYVGAGTVEFLVDKDRNYYFLEMNTRLQVEHPVTEMVTGLDLVAWQFLVAEGKLLPLQQDQIEMNGHAVEVRLYAEDPRADFMPQTGTVELWRPEKTMRVDSGISQGQVISPYFDPMLAKLIVHADSRSAALQRLDKAIGSTYLLGINHNLHFLQGLVSNRDFIDSGATTAFIQEQYADGCYQDLEPSKAALCIAAIAKYRLSQHSKYYRPQRWGTSAPIRSMFELRYAESNFTIGVTAQNDHSYDVILDDQKYTVDWREVSESEFSIDFSGKTIRCAAKVLGDDIFVQETSGHYLFEDRSQAPVVASNPEAELELRASMDGAIVDVNVELGDTVEAGQVLVVLEAMKMAHQYSANASGVVAELGVKVGDQVKSKTLLVRLEGEQEES